MPFPDDPRLEDRKIASRLSMSDGTTEVAFECGHVTIQIVPIPATWDRMRCAQCINEYVEANRG